MNRPVETPLGVDAISEAASKSLINGTILASAARAAAAYTSGTFKNVGFPGLRLFVNATAMGAAGTLVVKVQIQDPVSGAWVDLEGAVTASIVAAALTTLTIFPGIATSANERIDDHLGITWRVVATVGVNDVTFSVGGEYLGS
jgi:hypothetical protein